MEKEKTAVENHYKIVTDEYFKLYVAFMRSGFTKEEAFELMKAYCTSDGMARMLDGLTRGSRYKEPSNIHKYMGKQQSDTREKTNEATGS